MINVNNNKQYQLYKPSLYQTTGLSIPLRIYLMDIQKCVIAWLVARLSTRFKQKKTRPTACNFKLNGCITLSWILFLLICMTTPGKAINSVSILQTQKKIKQLTYQIDNLQQTLNHAHDKRGLLKHELTATEKQIGMALKQLHHLKQSIVAKQQTIHQLEQHISQLTKQLTIQQHLLAQHVCIRYKMGEHQPIKWLLNQDNPYAIDRLLTFHQYLIHSRQQIIAKIDATKHSLTQNHELLKIEIIQQQSLQARLHVHQNTLWHNKRYHHAVIQSLNDDIQQKQQTLSEFQQNKENLSQLLTSIAVKNVVYADTSFAKMRHKLPKPVYVEPRSMHLLNQGVMFFAAEGKPVNAVYSGKVVFSDWLNGYGLLLIIDHGQGFMTLYAHNQSFFKRKGSIVKQGESIAAVGHTGGSKQNGLYFEVRERGKAVMPLEWLA